MQDVSLDSFARTSLFAAILLLAGCGRPDPRLMTQNAVSAEPPFSKKAVLIVDGTWQGLKLLGVDLGPNMNLRFQNISLISDVGVGLNGGPVPDLFDALYGFGPGFTVVSPGTYVLIAAAQTEQRGDLYKFDIPSSPIRFTVKAGDVVDVGHFVFTYENGGNCPKGLARCDTAIRVSAVPHATPEQARSLAALQKSWPNGNTPPIHAASA